MKKILVISLAVFLSFIFMACEPLTTQASLNTNITQSTTTVNTYVPVTWINVEADMQEVCQGAVITLTVTVQPVNATNQNYTITVNPTTMLTEVPGTSQLQWEVTGNTPTSEIEQNILTITSADNSSITNTVSIYVYPDTYSPPQCQIN